MNQFSRTELLLGSEAMDKLRHSHVAIFGIGGVGSFAVEALARSGIGSLSLIDDDVVSVTNINRQLIATLETVGQSKVEVMKSRILNINPDAEIFTHQCFYTAQTAAAFNLSQYDYIIDAIDTISSKLELIERSYKNKIPVISCMGAGNKLDPTRFEVSDIYKTSVCPLARVMRRELKARHIPHLKVVYSKEEALKPAAPAEKETITPNRPGAAKRQTPGSISFVPSVAGLILAGEVIRELIL